MAQESAIPVASQNATPFNDPAEGILKGDVSLTDSDRANLWDVFHNSKDHNELAQKLQNVLIPSDTKHALWQAKAATAPVPSQVEKIVSSLSRLKDMDPDTLAIAERYPQVAKAVIDAAVKPPEMAPGVPAGKSEGSAKGKEAENKPQLVQAPRRDGTPHLPPIPEKHYRIMGSDRRIHDIPFEKLEEARTIDPDLHVLNP